jgi:hypothetical protein
MPLARQVRVRGIVCLMTALAGCLARSTTVPPEPEVSCEAHYATQQSAPIPELSLVIAISDAPAMARYREAVIGVLRELAAALATDRMGLRIAVVASGPGDIARTLDDLDLPWFLCTGDCRSRNYTGPLDDALVGLAPLAAGSAAAPPLLERIEHALAAGGGFLAPGGYLGVVVIAADDDGSPGDPAEYAARLAARVPPEHLHVALVTGDASPRLDRFARALERRGGGSGARALERRGGGSGTRAERASIDAADLSDAFHFGRLFPAPLWLACLDDVDVGACVVTDRDGARIPECAMAAPDRPDPSTPLPCWWLARNVACIDGVVPTVERAHQAGWRDASIACACLAGT